MTRKRLVILAASMAIVAILAVGGFATVFAAGSPTPASGSSTTSRAQTFLDRLASNLGISTDKLQQGLKTTADQYVDQALANKKITQAQADAAKQKIANGNGLNAFTRFFGRHDRRMDMLGIASWQDIATALNTTPQDLRSQIQSGTTLKQIIANKGMTVDGVVANVKAQIKTKLDQRVANGTMTSTQETNVLNNLTTRLTNLINNGGPRFGHPWHPQASPTSASPSA